MYPVVPPEPPDTSYESAQLHARERQLRAKFDEALTRLQHLQLKDNLDKAIKNMLRFFTSYRPNLKERPITIADAKDVSEGSVNITSLTEDPSYHYRDCHSIYLLREFMISHDVEYVGSSFAKYLDIKHEEYQDFNLGLRLWFVKLQEATHNQIRRCLEVYRADKRRKREQEMWKSQYCYYMSRQRTERSQVPYL